LGTLRAENFAVFFAVVDLLSLVVALSPFSSFRTLDESLPSWPSTACNSFLSLRSSALSAATLPTAFETAAFVRAALLETFTVAGLAVALVLVLVLLVVLVTGAVKAGAARMRAMIVFLTSMMVIINGR